MTEDQPYTVAQMIAELQKLPPDMRVMVTGYEGGYHDASEPKVDDIRLNMHRGSSYYGPHDHANYLNGDQSGEIVKAAII